VIGGLFRCQTGGMIENARMPPDFLKTVFLPLGILIIMFGMGMTLRPADFARVLFSPKAKVIGLLLQLLMLPLLAFGLATALRLPGELAAGLMLVAACPGGPTSNIISHLSRGDTALSVTLTAVSSIITVLTIPLVLAFSLAHFTDQEAQVVLPFWKTFAQLMIVTVVPILAGMWLLARAPRFCARMSRPLTVFSIVFLTLVILAAVLREEDLVGQFRAVGPAVVALNLAGMGIAFAVASASGLDTAQRISITVEVGIQNATLALAIALGILESARLAIPAVVYGLLMFVSGFAVISLCRWRGRRG